MRQAGTPAPGASPPRASFAVRLRRPEAGTGRGAALAAAGEVSARAIERFRAAVAAAGLEAALEHVSEPMALPMFHFSGDPRLVPLALALEEVEDVAGDGPVGLLASPRPDATGVARYLSGLAIPEAPPRIALDAPACAGMARCLVAGSNMIGFGEEVDPPLRAAVSRSLLLAQLAVDRSRLARTPVQWYHSYETVLAGLGWRTTAFHVARQTFETANASLHRAILPALVAALGPAATAGSLLIEALEGLGRSEADAPWITLFERESKRLDVSDHQFTAVHARNGAVEAHLVGAVLRAEREGTQVLFFRSTAGVAAFDLVRGTLSAEAAFLRSLAPALEDKLSAHAATLIREVTI